MTFFINTKAADRERRRGEKLPPTWASQLWKSSSRPGFLIVLLPREVSPSLKAIKVLAYITDAQATVDSL